jgi:hypothetical protein
MASFLAAESLPVVHGSSQRERAEGTEKRNAAFDLIGQRRRLTHRQPEETL